ncbi:hypothetical protein acdb102_44900 [Acidothermaceae bacterium B102]|nr:hypothetical protein acdb102_44900 [Acidothermaceae bacterium B102]
MRLTRTGVVLGSVITFVAIGGTAVASNGAALLLGKPNTATVVTTLTNASGVPLALNAKPYWPALQVNTTAQINNLNADLLNGHHADAFLSAMGKAADSAKLGGQPASAYLSTIYTASTRSDGTPSVVPLPDGNRFDSIAVPAGNYQLGLTASVSNVDPTVGDYQCSFLYVVNGLPSLGQDGAVDISGGHVGTLAASDTVTFSKPTTVSARCLARAGNASNSAYVFESHLTATPIAVVHGTVTTY